MTEDFQRMCAVMPDPAGAVKLVIVLIEADNGIIEEISVVAGKRIFVDVLGLIPQNHPLGQRGCGCGAEGNIPFGEGCAFAHVGIPNILTSCPDAFHICHERILCGTGQQGMVVP